MKKFFLLIITVVLTGCIQYGLPKTSKESLYATETKMSSYATANGYNHISNKAAIDLISRISDDLGDFHSNGYVENYEARVQHGLGYSKKYNSGDMTWADVYTYHARKIGLKDGIKSETFKQLYEENIKVLPEHYGNIRNEKDETVSYNGIDFKKYSFVGKNFKMKRDVKSFLFLTIYDGVFLKARLDYYTGYEQGEQEVESFMNNMTTDLKKTGV